MKQSLLIIFLCLASPSSYSQVKIFEEGTISTGDVFATSLSADNNELFFVRAFGGRARMQIHFSKRINGSWQRPQSLFDTSAVRYIDPFLSVDGQTLFFNSDQQLPGKPDNRRFHIWKTQRIENGWSEPVAIPELNSDSADFYAGANKHGDIYFASARPNKTGGTSIWMAGWNNGKYNEPILLDTIINSTGTESNPFISPDGDYLVFLRSDKSGYGDSDLYISFLKNGKWTRPLNMGAAINTRFGEFAPFVSKNNRRLYFTRLQRGTPLKENIYYYPRFDKLLLKMEKKSMRQENL